MALGSGPGLVFTKDEDIALYRDAYSPYWDEKEERVASGAVAPATLEQVQAVVRTANQYKIPIYPISTGRNLAYGGSAPVYSGSVVLDLKRLNKVIEVNERNAYALVEPGVSYFDLYEHIQKEKLDVWIDPPDPGWGSVIGNALDGGGGWTASPFRDHFGSHCGMEVVLANGDVVRTGMGALPNSKSWQQSRWGFGPWVDGLFRQSNFGVVTKMGFYLMPRPEALMSATVTSTREEDIVPMLDALNLLENQHVVNGSTQIYGGPDRPASNSPTWSIQLPIYGPEAVVRAQMEYAKSKFTGIPGVKLTEGELFRTPLTPEAMARVRLVNFGIPNLSTFGMLGRSPANPAPAGGHIGFSPIVPRTGEALLEFKRFYRDNLSKVSGGENLGIIGPVYMTCWERTLVCLIMFPIGKDKTQNGKMRKAFESWVHLAAERRLGGIPCARGVRRIWCRTPTPTTTTHSAACARRSRMRWIRTASSRPAATGVWPKHLRRKT